MNEIWKDIPLPELQEKYQVSNLGRVKSIRFNKERIMKLGYNKWGYKRIELGKGSQYSVHRLIAMTFLENPDNKPEVNHIDGDKTNNHVDNLEWCTSSENKKHAIAIGLNVAKKGEQHHMYGKTGSDAVRSKKVICNDTGEVFDSLKQASQRLNVKYTTLAMQIRGVNPNKYNLEYCG